MVGSVPVKVASFGGLDFFTPENQSHFEKVGETEEGKHGYDVWNPRGQVSPFNADKDIVDNQVAILQYANGVRATFGTNCYSGIPERRFLLIGTDGAIRGDVLTGTIEFEATRAQAKRQTVVYEDSNGHGGGDSHLQNNLGLSITGVETPLAGIEEGLQSAISAFGVDQALACGQVVDLRPMWKKAGVKLEDPSL
jgi:predicted dehydrogenase